MCKAYVQTTYCKKCKGNNDKGFNIEFKKVKNYTQEERWEQKEQRSDNLISITEIFIQKRLTGSGYKKLYFFSTVDT